MTTFSAVAAAMIALVGAMAAFRVAGRVHPRRAHPPFALFVPDREGDRDLSRERSDLLAIRAHTMRPG